MAYNSMHTTLYLAPFTRHSPDCSRFIRDDRITPQESYAADKRSVASSPDAGQPRRHGTAVTTPLKRGH